MLMLLKNHYCSIILYLNKSIDMIKIIDMKLHFIW